MMIAFFPSVSLASIDNSNFNYKIKIQEDGKFEIKFNQNYGDDIAVSDLFKKYFLNSSMQVALDKNMSLFKTSNYVQLKVTTLGTHTYSLSVVASKNSMDARIKSKCTMIVKSKSITNDCNITKASSMLVNKFFHFGSTKIHCSKSYKNESICQITVTGRPQAINLFIKSFSEERLAVSGSYETVLSTYRGFYYLKENKSSGHDSTSFYKDNIKTLWDEMIVNLAKQQHLKGTLKVESSNSGIIKEISR